WIDGDKADQIVATFRKNDLRYRDEFVAPTLAPPRQARVKIKMRVVLRPGAPPQFNRGVFIGRGVTAERVTFFAHRSVSLNSMRRLRLLEYSVLQSSNGGSLQNA